MEEQPPVDIPMDTPDTDPSVAQAFERGMQEEYQPHPDEEQPLPVPEVVEEAPQVPDASDNS